jgi:Mg2+ and Co2+ transporter CorA
MPDTRARGERGTSESEGRVRIRLFDADRTDRILAFDEAMKAKMSDRQLLWIDVEGVLDDEARAAIVERFELASSTDRALAEESSQPHIELHGRHFQLAVAAEPDAEHPERAKWLDIVAGPNLVISRHHEPLEFLEALNGRIAGDATIGELDSAEFVASLLDSIVTTYHAAVDGIEDELDEFDARALRRPTGNDLFSELVTIRRRVGRLRRLLAAHREVFGSLGRRDFGRGIESADPDVFVPVTGRFDAALVSVESTREVVLASFDVLMTRTAQRTNDVMRVLTLATVLALPATVTAGLLGMNVVVPVPSDAPTSFWAILGMIALLELAVVGIARLKGWI